MYAGFLRCFVRSLWQLRCATVEQFALSDEIESFKGLKSLCENSATRNSAAKQVAEKVPPAVILSEAKNLS